MSKMEKWFLVFCIMEAGGAGAVQEQTSKVICIILAFVFGMGFLLAPGKGE